MQTWVLSGRPYEEMPEGADTGLVTQFIKDILINKKQKILNI